jgi:ERCC4-type nuclease
MGEMGEVSGSHIAIRHHLRDSALEWSSQLPDKREKAAKYPSHLFDCYISALLMVLPAGDAVVNPYWKLYNRRHLMKR